MSEDLGLKSVDELVHALSFSQEGNRLLRKMGRYAKLLAMVEASQCLQRLADNSYERKLAMNRKSYALRQIEKLCLDNRS